VDLMTTLHPTRTRSVLSWALLIDLICVVAFAAGGKSAHDDSSTWWVIARIAWPYALACLLAHFVVWRRGWEPRQWRPAGFVVLATTYVLGMVLRLISGRGIAIGFLIVAIIFLGLTMLGWRALNAAWQTRGRSSAPRSGPASTR
jgi:FtsH-binding integral membrane protein